MVDRRFSLPLGRPRSDVRKNWAAVSLRGNAATQPGPASDVVFFSRGNAAIWTGFRRTPRIFLSEKQLPRGKTGPTCFPRFSPKKIPLFAGEKRSVICGKILREKVGRPRVRPSRPFFNGCNNRSPRCRRTIPCRKRKTRPSGPGCPMAETGFNREKGERKIPFSLSPASRKNSRSFREKRHFSEAASTDLASMTISSLDRSLEAIIYSTPSSAQRRE